MENRDIPQAGQLYRHFKGMLYQIVGIAKHSETGELLVVYQALYEDFGLYVRPLGMFMSEVDHEKYPYERQKYRFSKVERSTLTGKKGTEKEVKEKEHIETGKVDENLMAFLDAKDCAEKLEILYAIKDGITDRLLSDIESSLDLAIGQGSIEERIAIVRDNLMTMQKFECKRLR